MFRRVAIAHCVMVMVLGAGAASGADKVTFATNWKAEAEHGGFYQAVADGTYSKYGLDVTIRAGGPQSNERALLVAGKVDFIIGGNMMPALSAVKEGIPTRVVAAIMQKDPQCLMTHPGQGLDTWESLRKATLLVGKDGFVSFYQWMIADWGFTEAQVKPYLFNPAPFLADKRVAQQGYVTAEPYAIERQGGFRPNIFLLADHGFDRYATTIETRLELIERNPDLVRRFVDASIGWYSYLYGDPRPANALIKKRQSGDDRRPARLWPRSHEAARHGRLGRCPEARHRRDDRRALEGFFATT